MIETPPCFPTFVYGTLRPGGGNDVLWRGIAYARFDGDSFLFGYGLYAPTPHMGFPYALPDHPGMAVVGTLLHAVPGWYEALMERLDTLEGVEFGHYERVLVDVLSPEGISRAWLYTPPARRVEEMKTWCRPVPGNDWRKITR